jgi:hypothetical protein
VKTERERDRVGGLDKITEKKLYVQVKAGVIR